VDDLLERVKARSSVPFNHVLFNRYRSAEDAMGMHSDDERELGQNPVLASLSLGATRRFVISPRGKSDSPCRFALELAHGSLLIMGGSFQHTYRHGIPRQRAPLAERINLTFRRLLTIPSP
jgi:alkylated DNA repair dioxygenase AlkB